MKVIIRMLTAILILCCLAGTAFAAKDPIPQEVLLAAQAGLGRFTGAVHINPQGFGFERVEQLSGVSLGEGFPCFRVDMEALLQRSENSLLAALKKEPSWTFVVMLDGRPKSFLFIDRYNGKYTAVKWGGNATGFMTGLENFRRLAAEKGSAQEPTLVRVGMRHIWVANIGGEEVFVNTLNPEDAKRLREPDFTQLTSTAPVVKDLKMVRPVEVKPGDPIRLGGTGLFANTQAASFADSSQATRPDWWRPIIIGAGGGVILLGLFLARKRFLHRSV